MNLKLTASLGLVLSFSAITYAQTEAVPPPPQPSPTPRMSDQLAKALEGIAQRPPTPREQRELAYAKLLEGQRYIWNSERVRTRTGRQNNVRLAREAIQRSVELDPMLSEGYTALAELALNGQPQDADESVRLAELATKVNPNNFGARRILGRLYSFQSRLMSGPFDGEAGERAITEWKHVVRLDPRNAEGWALLSELYDKTGKSEEAIEALRRWLSSAAPVDARFYQLIMGGQTLAPENASLKLGSTLLKAGRTREAVETLSLLVIDDPSNYPAVELLREAVEEANPEALAIAVDALRQAVSSNPSSLSMINLLAQIQARSGKIDDAAKLLRESSIRLLGSDRNSAAVLQISLGDLMAQADRPKDALAAYEASFATRGLDNAMQISEDEREFAVRVFEKIIQNLKNANRIDDARAAIERSRKMLGKDDLFADRQLISLYRESGNRTAALAAVKGVRMRVPDDYGFIRLEATLLTETGNVDAGVALIRKLIQSGAAKPPVTNSTPGSGTESITIAVPASDAFSNYLFISNLYSQANRGKDAVNAANEAYTVARGSERKQIARLTLATAQQMSNDFRSAEATLRELLKETPGNPIAMNNLGYFLLERNERLEEAFNLIQQAVKIDPTNPSYLDSFGWAYFKLTKFPEAEKYLKEALRFDTSSGTIHEHLGDVYEKQGKTGLARASWNRAASLFSDPADVKRLKMKLAVGK